MSRPKDVTIPKHQLDRLVRAAAAVLKYDQDQAKTSYQRYDGIDADGETIWAWSDAIWIRAEPRGSRKAIELRKALKPFT